MELKLLGFNRFGFKLVYNQLFRKEVFDLQLLLFGFRGFMVPGKLTGCEDDFICLV